jgi:hypothetical protein
MGHRLMGDWGLRLRTFDAFWKMAAPVSMGGVGVGAGGVELRWLLRDKQADQLIEELLLSQLPPTLLAPWTAFPIENDVDVALPMPCRTDQLIARIHKVMEGCDRGLTVPAYAKSRNLDVSVAETMAHFWEVEKAFAVGRAVTPVYRLAVWEIDGALDRLRAALPPPLRARLSREALLAERARNEDREAPNTRLVDELRDALPEPFQVLLFVVTWLLWHLPVTQGPLDTLRIVDDSALYEHRSYGLRGKRLSARGEVSLEEGRLAVDALRAELLAVDETDREELLAARERLMVAALELPATDASALRALDASAGTWQRLGVADRAQAERAWHALLSPKTKTKTPRPKT